MSRAEEMRELFDRWARSGKSLMAFGRQEGVSYAKLLYWRRKFGDEAVSTAGAAPKFVAVKVVADQQPQHADPGKFEVWLSNGIGIDVPSGFDEAELRRLVGAIQSC